MMTYTHTKATVKWNGGRCALLCDGCKTIIEEGMDKILPRIEAYPYGPYYCEACENGEDLE